MKQLLSLSFLLLFAAAANSQVTISPAETGEFCPNTDITFTVTIPYVDKTEPNPSVVAGGEGSIVQQDATNLKKDATNGKATFNFIGRFYDMNKTQSFKIIYYYNGSTTATQYQLFFKKIKSLYAGSCDAIYISHSITAPICQINDILISFNAVQWINAYDTPSRTCFGSIGKYDYVLPAGWKIGASVSDGVHPIVAGNSVTVTSDLSTGGDVKVRPSTAECATGLINAVGYTSIAIVRPQSFTISPATLSITCGSATPQTFTVNNGVLGATYTWNLGAAPNGWLLPNGDPAPEVYSSGSNSSITLTPVCGVRQSNVSATVTNGGTNCDAGTCAVTGTLPVMTIPYTGPICSGSGNFSVSGLPCNASVSSWTITPATGKASLSYSGNTATLTKTGNGTVQLSANVDACGTSTPVVQPIGLGMPVVINNLDHAWYTVNSASPLGLVPDEMHTVCVPANNTATVWATILVENGNGSWSGPNSVNPRWSANDNTATLTFRGTGASIFLTFTASNTCGSFQADYGFKAISCLNANSFNVSPNPATSVVNVEIASDATEINAVDISRQEEYTGEMIDVLAGKTVLTQKHLKKGTKNQVQVAHLRKGQYFLVIKNEKGEIVKKQQIILQ